MSVSNQNQTLALNLGGLATVVNKTYSYATSSLFIAFAKTFYIDYYTREIYPSMQWLNGYVHELHNSQTGIFSTKLANTLTKNIAKMVRGEKLIFKKTSDKKNVEQVFDYISRTWYNKSNIREALFTAYAWAFANGTSVLKQNYNAKTQSSWVEAVRIDKCYFSCDTLGNALSFNGVIFCTTSTNRTDNKKSDVYFLVEKRFYKTFKKGEILNGKILEEATTCSMVKYIVQRANGVSLQNLNIADINTIEKVQNGGLNYDLEGKLIPEEIKRDIKKLYGIENFGKESMLPFQDLGIEIVRNDTQNLMMADAVFGSSSLLAIQTDLINYELSNAYKVRDMYNGKGLLALNKVLTLGTAKQEQSNHVQNSPYASLDMPIIEIPTYADPDKFKPIVIQHEMRLKEWKENEDAIIESISVKLGISAKTIASYLKGHGGDKTATESQVESQATNDFITYARASLKLHLDRILDRELYVKGYENVIDIDFPPMAIIDKDKLTNREILKYDRGIQSLEDTIRNLNTDLSQDAIENLIANAQKRKEEMQREQIEMEQLINGTGNYDTSNGDEEDTN